MEDYSRISLLEAILLQYDRKCLSRILHDSEYRKMLADAIENKIPAESVTMLEWNEVLHLLCHCAPEESCERARRKVLCELRKA